MAGPPPRVEVGPPTRLVGGSQGITQLGWEFFSDQGKPFLYRAAGAKLGLAPPLGVGGPRAWTADSSIGRKHGLSHMRLKSFCEICQAIFFVGHTAKMVV